MENIHAQSVSDALSTALIKFGQHGIPEDSRNGKVLVMPTPVTTTYYQPQRRVLFNKERNANPFFHLMESLWMLGGRNDLLFPMLFNQRFREYSDDGSTIWGAYGWRWKQFFGYDQIDAIVNELRRNPNSRRCVLSMWNAMPVDGERDPHSGVLENGSVDVRADLHVAIGGGKDVPCNTHAYFDLRGGVLNMTVCNRSNDAWWGAYGANAVHFSILLEYMAARIGVPMGVYRQMSNNLHLYTDIVDESKLGTLATAIANDDLYTNPDSPQFGRETMPIVDCKIDDWHQDLHYILTRNGIHNEHSRWNSEFLGGVAVPMYLAYDAWRNKQYDEAWNHVQRIDNRAWDWKNAASFWLFWRAQARNAVNEQDVVKAREAAEANGRG